MMLINGKPQAQIEVTDRGFHYGDGLFETIEILNSQLVFFEQHLQRLTYGCRRLLLPGLDIALITQEALQLAQDCPHGVLKIIITRGSGGRGYQQPKPLTATRVLLRYPFPDYPDSFQKHGVNIKFCQQRLSLNSTLAGLKHLNRLEQVLARAEWQNSAIQEGLMLDTDNYVIEGTMSNVFFISKDKLYTPTLELSGITGIIRAFVLKTASTLDIESKQGQFTKHDLLTADELFITNSIIGIWPIKVLEQQSFDKGILTQQLQQTLMQNKQQFYENFY